MKTIDVLRKARELISDPARWTQGHPAAAEDGRLLWDGSDPLATRWCAIGAIDRAAGKRKRVRRAAQDALVAVLPDSWGGSVSEYNDAPERKHGGVLRLFDRAIAAAERES